MKISKYMEIFPTAIPNIFTVVDKSDGTILVQYKISPFAGYMQNAELAAALIEVYENYYKSITKGKGE